MIREDHRSISFPVVRVRQPIGDFYIGAMKAKDLVDIAWFDIRQLFNSGNVDEYLGIQRRINEDRVKEIAKYVRLTDATFPTAVILAVEADCAALNPINALGGNRFFEMTLQNKPGEFDDPETVLFRGIARVLDGQHRIRGLHDSKHDLDDFEINVSIFVDADIADQAAIFSTVNLAQTKVNRSLAIDLLSYSKSRSPERTCHFVTVALDQQEKSPFFHKIKRLGVATDGRFGETLSQATVVKALLPYISNDPIADRDVGKRIGHWPQGRSFDEKKLIFRQWFIENNDEQIAKQVMHYFEAVKRRWPVAWHSTDTGVMLSRTNGFLAFMKFLRPAYNSLSSKNSFVPMSKFLHLFAASDLTDSDFTTAQFPPGSSGETALYRKLYELVEEDPFIQ